MREHIKTLGSAAILAILSGGFVAGASLSHAQSVDTTGASHCEVRAFLTDPDPEGTNVRAAPRGNAPVIGHLAPFIHLTPDDDVGAEVEITATPPDKGAAVHGWSFNPCASQLTTCDRSGPE